MTAISSARRLPLLARPWVHLQSLTDPSRHNPAWLSKQQQDFTEKLFRKGIHAEPVVVAETLAKSRGTYSPQVAFAGRSNVGKSTLLNALLHNNPDPLKGKFISERKKLTKPKCAPVSHKPGRTRHLFRFEIGGLLTFVDLPGYGYASAPRGTRESWSNLIDGYFSTARCLQRVISLVDAKVGVKASDQQLWEMLQRENLQLMVVLTKADQVDPHGLHDCMAQTVALLQQLDPTHLWPYVHAVSALHGHGVHELRMSLSAIASDASGGHASTGAEVPKSPF
eukprot:TRINITY_DN75766_c0_g1_i1.p1 TRINITY_DN75766_c0_g1~~TRINITY_DN75766_c0_g1_i1.p1  ORF type:complete len:281 (-),score=10.31 TRINITY_DN75766_c0_g1_i1:170-1012(-)